MASLLRPAFASAQSIAIVQIGNIRVSLENAGKRSSASVPETQRSPRPAPTPPSKRRPLQGATEFAVLPIQAPILTCSDTWPPPNVFNSRSEARSNLPVRIKQQSQMIGGDAFDLSVILDSKGLGLFEMAQSIGEISWSRTRKARAGSRRRRDQERTRPHVEAWIWRRRTDSRHIGALRDSTSPPSIPAATRAHACSREWLQRFVRTRPPVAPIFAGHRDLPAPGPSGRRLWSRADFPSRVRAE